MDISGTIGLSGDQVMRMYIAFIVASALVQALPIPREDSNVVYATIYKFLSLLIADFRGYVSKNPPKQLSNPTTPAEPVQENKQ